MRAVDQIILDKTTFTALATLNQLDANRFAAVNTNGEVQASSALIVYSKETGHLFYKSVAAGASGFGIAGVQFATLANRPQDLLAGNFTLQL